MRLFSNGNNVVSNCISIFDTLRILSLNDGGFSGEEHTKSNTNFFEVLWWNLLTNVQLQFLIVVVVFVIVCCCCCLWGVCFFLGLRFGLWKKIIGMTCGTLRDSENGSISKRKLNFKKSRRKNDFLEKLAKNQDTCYLVIDDDDSFDWACEKLILLYDVGEVVSYGGYIVKRNEKFYFCMDPPLQRWRFVDDTWKRVKSDNELERHRFKLRESECKWINLEPVGQVLNSKSLAR